MSESYWVVRDSRGCFWNKDWLDWMASIFHATKIYTLEKAEKIAGESGGKVFRVALTCEKEVHRCPGSST